MSNPSKNKNAKQKTRRNPRMIGYRVMALFLAALMLLGAVATVLYYVLL